MPLFLERQYDRTQVQYPPDMVKALHDANPGGVSAPLVTIRLGRILAAATEAPHIFVNVVWSGRAVVRREHAAEERPLAAMAAYGSAWQCNATAYGDCIWRLHTLPCTAYGAMAIGGSDTWQHMAVIHGSATLQYMQSYMAAYGSAWQCSRIQRDCIAVQHTGAQ